MEEWMQINGYMRRKLLNIYSKLYAEFGPRHWWPADTPFEVIVGAILTQNTAWRNVEKAIANLKKERLMLPAKMKAVNTRRLARLIKPSGYYNSKALKLKAFIDFLYSKYGGSLKRFLRLPLSRMRGELLSIWGIGPETADSIILYAARKPVFVVDAYTRRVLSRHRLIKSGAGYDDIQHFFMDNLPARAKLFNEYHALIVELCKAYCRKTPLCRLCPLKLA